MANNSAEVSQIADSLSERLNGVLDSPVLLDDRHNTNLKKKINEAVLIGLCVCCCCCYHYDSK